MPSLLLNPRLLLPLTLHLRLQVALRRAWAAEASRVSVLISVLSSIWFTLQIVVCNLPVPNRRSLILGVILVFWWLIYLLYTRYGLGTVQRETSCHRTGSAGSIVMYCCAFSLSLYTWYTGTVVNCRLLLLILLLLLLLSVHYYFINSTVRARCEIAR